MTDLSRFESLFETKHPEFTYFSRQKNNQPHYRSEIARSCSHPGSVVVSRPIPDRRTVRMKGLYG